MPALDIRKKFHLVLAGLFALVLLIGGVAIWQLGRLGNAIDVVMRENFRSVAAMQEFEEALERMDSAALLAVSGDVERAREMVEVHDEFARQAVDIELGNITLPGERERAETLEADYVAYRRSLRELLREDATPQARRALYFDRINPEFDRLKREADELIEVNQERMVAANEAAHERARNARVALLLLVFLAAWLAFYIASITFDLPMRPVRQLDAYLRGETDGLPESWEDNEELSRLVDAIDEVREESGERDVPS